MKIGIDCRTVSALGGIGEYSRQLVKRIIEQNDLDQLVLFFESSDLVKHFQHHNVVIKIIPFSRYRRFLPIIYSQLIVPLFFLLENCSVMLFCANVAPYLYRKKFVAVIHDLAVYKFPQYFPDKFFHFDRWFLVPSTLHRAVKLIAVSHSTKNDIVSLFRISSDKIEVIHEGGDFFVFDQGEKTILNNFSFTRKIILFLGTIEPRKNILNLLSAYKKLVTINNCDADLVLIGKAGWKSKDIFQAIDEINQTLPIGQIRHLGYLSADDKMEFYQNAQVLVLPSWYEGFGLPVAEAMHFGLPSIISPYGSLPEIGADASLITNDGSAEEIYSALKRFIFDDDLRKKLSLKSQARAKIFSWRLSAEKVIGLLRRV